jgi:hypothetical protein
VKVEGSSVTALLLFDMTVLWLTLTGTFDITVTTDKFTIDITATTRLCRKTLY